MSMTLDPMEAMDVDGPKEVHNKPANTTMGSRSSFGNVNIDDAMMIDSTTVPSSDVINNNNIDTGSSHDIIDPMALVSSSSSAMNAPNGDTNHTSSVADTSIPPPPAAPKRRGRKKKVEVATDGVLLPGTLVNGGQEIGENGRPNPVVRQGRQAESTIDRRGMFWQHIYPQSDGTPRTVNISCSALTHLADTSCSTYNFHDPWNGLKASLIGEKESILSSTIQTWPKSSTMPCWLDQEAFDGPPVLIPRHYDNRTRTFGNFYGNFCSFACAKRHLAERFDPDAAMQQMYLSHVAREIFRVPAHVHLQVAPSSRRLKRYGGDLDAKEFRQMSEQYVFDIVHDPVFTTHYMVIECLQQQQHSGGSGYAGFMHATTSASPNHTSSSIATQRFNGACNNQTGNVACRPGQYTGGGNCFAMNNGGNYFGTSPVASPQSKCAFPNMNGSIGSTPVTSLPGVATTVGAQSHTWNLRGYHGPTDVMSSVPQQPDRPTNNNNISAHQAPNHSPNPQNTQQQQHTPSTSSMYHQFLEKKASVLITTPSPTTATTSSTFSGSPATTHPSVVTGSIPPIDTINGVLQINNDISNCFIPGPNNNAIHTSVMENTTMASGPTIPNQVPSMNCDQPQHHSSSSPQGYHPRPIIFSSPHSMHQTPSFTPPTPQSFHTMQPYSQGVSTNTAPLPPSTQHAMTTPAQTTNATNNSGRYGTTLNCFFEDDPMGMTIMGCPPGQYAPMRANPHVEAASGYSTTPSILPAVTAAQAITAQQQPPPPIVKKRGRGRPPRNATAVNPTVTVQHIQHPPPQHQQQSIAQQHPHHYSMGAPQGHTSIQLQPTSHQQHQSFMMQSQSPSSIQPTLQNVAMMDPNALPPVYTSVVTATIVDEFNRPTKRQKQQDDHNSANTNYAPIPTLYQHPQAS